MEEVYLNCCPVLMKCNDTTGVSCIFIEILMNVYTINISRKLIFYVIVSTFHR